MLALPSFIKNIMLYSSVTSMTNLKKHIHWSHPTSVAKFQTCVDNYKIIRKRKKTKESENNLVKKKMLQTLVTDNQYPKPRQEV